MKRRASFLFLLCGILWPLASLASTVPTVFPPPFETTEPAADVADIQFIDETGTKLSLSSYRGKYVIVNLWATWCGPCVREMPALDSLAELGDALGLAVLPISMDRAGAPKVREFYNSTGIKNLPLLMDTDRQVARFIKPRGLPLTLVLNRQGKEIARVYGPVEWNSEAMLAFIRKLTGF